MNLLLISIDSLRIDYVSRTNPQIHTPRFDALTRDFCFYNGLFSASTATRPVHTSLFTGLYPFEHGIMGQSSSAMHMDLPHLFAQVEQAGYRVHCFSEAHELFTGLNFAPYMSPLHPPSLSEALHYAHRQPRFVFLHYWGAHTPYGAADQSALGETAELLRTGKTHIVKGRYKQAVERVLDRQIASVLDAINPREWNVVIFSDHGESWTAEEPYHGYTLRNSVLRIPLYFHFPGTGNPPPPKPVASLIDLYPTLLNVAGVEHSYAGFATDLRQEDEKHSYKLAQIHPDPMPNDLKIPGSETNPFSPVTGPQWCLFDALTKYTYDEKRQEGWGVQSLSETPISLRETDHLRFQSAMEDLVRSSHVSKSPPDKLEAKDATLLEQRLRDLGYLD